MDPPRSYSSLGDVAVQWRCPSTEAEMLMHLPDIQGLILISTMAAKESQVSLISLSAICLNITCFSRSTAIYRSPALTNTLVSIWRRYWHPTTMLCDLVKDSIHTHINFVFWMQSKTQTPQARMVIMLDKSTFLQLKRVKSVRSWPTHHVSLRKSVMSPVCPIDNF